MSGLVRAALLLALTSAPAAAQETCPFPGQRPMLVVQLFFGQTIHGKGLVSARSWQRFLAETVTVPARRLHRLRRVRPMA